MYFNVPICVLSFSSLRCWSLLKGFVTHPGTGECFVLTGVPDRHRDPMLYNSLKVDQLFRGLVQPFKRAASSASVLEELWNDFHSSFSFAQWFWARLVSWDMCPTITGLIHPWQRSIFSGNLLANLSPRNMCPIWIRVCWSELLLPQQQLSFKVSSARMKLQFKGKKGSLFMSQYSFYSLPKFLLRFLSQLLSVPTSWECKSNQEMRKWLPQETHMTATGMCSVDILFCCGIVDFWPLAKE